MSDHHELTLVFPSYSLESPSEIDSTRFDASIFELPLTFFLFLPLLFSSTTIMFGADVTHPPARGGGDSHIPPSIVAVVATLNGQNNSYRAEVRLPEGRTEIIQDMKGVCISLLRKYRLSNANKPPSHIIFYVRSSSFCSPFFPIQASSSLPLSRFELG